jgi:hypothetical protein
MLTRLTSAISIAILATGTTVALDAVPASARPGPRIHAHVAHTKTLPGNSGRSGGGGGGKAGPPPCPPNTNCATNVLGNPAPAAQVRTIDVAYDAYDQLELPAPHIHTSPSNKTYVQLRTGLWLDPGDHTEKTASASAGGQTVTAIGTPSTVTWNMGESTVTCDTAGSRKSTKCGYTYQRSSADQPNGKYAISVTVTWNVRWTCEGVQCEAAGGDFDPPTMTMTSNATLAVGEVQTESRPG